MRFVVGDIHGCFDKFMSAINHSGFDPRKDDVLYCLGDFCDRGDNSAAVLEYLLLFPNNRPDSLKSVFGNHDLWLYQYLESELNNKHLHRDIWDTWDYNGGRKTIESLKWIPKQLKEQIFEWLGNLPYRIELDDFIIQHTPIKEDIRRLVEDRDPCTLTLKYCLDNDMVAKDYDSWFWCRDAIYKSKVINGERAIPNVDYTITSKPLIVGHTPLVEGPYWDKDLNIIALDTGSFISAKKYGTTKDGEICILNLDNKEWFKSNGDNGKLE